MIARYKEASLYPADFASVQEKCWLTGEAIHFAYLLLAEQFPFHHISLVNPSLVSFLLFQEQEQDLLPLKKLNLFQYRYLYLPINTNSQKHQNGNHWVLCIYDTLKSEFYMMNSMEGFPQNVQKIKLRLEKLRLLFKNEETNIKIEVISNIPKQSNNYDCGVFLIYYTHSTLEQIRESQSNILSYHQVKYRSEYFEGIREWLRGKMEENKATVDE